MPLRLTIARVLIFLTLASALPSGAQKIFITSDISPDPDNYSPASGSNPAGRIKSLIVDPNNDTIVYAASEFAGVWKSTTGATWVGGSNAHSTAAAMKWFQASEGLRSGLTQSNNSLAIDKANSKRLLYATGVDDGRPTPTGAGLYISLNAAGVWTHVNLPCPSGTQPGIASVAFASGQPYVSTPCGIYTTSNAKMAEGTWTGLPTFPSAPPIGSLVVDGGYGTLFGCSGQKVFRATDLGVSGVWQSFTLPSGASCGSIAAAPNGTAASTVAIVIWNVTTNSNLGLGYQEVSVVNFATSTATSLNYAKRPDQNYSRTKPPQSFATPGSGVLGVAVVPISSVPGNPPGPGITYDVYAADDCAWYGYNPTPSSPANPWTMLGYLGQECGGTTSIHVDSWAMAFPSWYDSSNGSCAAYAATDGGVFFTGYKQPGPVIGGCVNNWGMVQHGLHVLYSNAVWAITAGSTPYSSTPITEAIYLPTGDNDTFVTTFGYKAWQSLPDYLGDSAQALVDPAFPNQVLASRNENYAAIFNPPTVGGTSNCLVTGGTTTACIPAPPPPKKPPTPSTTQLFDNGNAVMGTADLTQVMTSRFELSTPQHAADYLAVFDQDTAKCSASLYDLILRNRSNPPTYTGWTTDISKADHFLPCDIGKIQASGGHSGGSLTVYILTGFGNKSSNPPVIYNKGRGPGQIYKGVTNKLGQVVNWTLASPTLATDNFFVNPYNANELYSVSTAGGVIQYSRNGGTTWETNNPLTDIATNHGEYRIGCAGGRGGTTETSPFTDGCSLSGMAFDPFLPKVRVAAMFYGGIAFSRDSGKHWISLDITDNNHLVTNNLTQIVTSVFFDGETHGKGTKKPPIPTPDQRIYFSLKGQSIRAVLGPFLNLESLNFSLKLSGTHVVEVHVATPAFTHTIRLYQDTATGEYRGSLLYDYATAAKVNFQYTVDGAPGYTGSHVLKAAETTAGVATESH
jgi:hypothetical protein